MSLLRPHLRNLTLDLVVTQNCSGSDGPESYHLCNHIYFMFPNLEKVDLWLHLAGAQLDAALDKTNYLIRQRWICACQILASKLKTKDLSVYLTLATPIPG